MAVINGNAGNNLRLGTADADTMFGRSGNDTLLGLLSDDSLYGGSGRDTLYGGQGDDTLGGGAGNDVLIGAEGNDDLRGGSGIDTADYRAAADAVTLSLSDGVASADGDGGVDTLSSIEIVLGSEFADRLSGSTTTRRLDGLDGDDDLFGGAGSAVLRGGDGRDWLFGGAAPSSLLGGTGNDVLASGDSGDHLDGGAGSDDIAAGAGNDVVLGGGGVEDDADLGDGDDRFFGGAGSDFVGGGNGNDSIYGAGGHDNLADGRGDDLVVGGTGNDEIYIDLGDDLLYGDDLGAGSGRDLFLIGAERFFDFNPNPEDREGFQSASTSTFSVLREDGIGTKTVVDFEVGIDRLVLYGAFFAAPVFAALDVNGSGFLDADDTGIVSLRDVTVAGVERQSLVIDVAAWREASFGATVNGTEEVVFYGIGENVLTVDDFGF